MEVWWIMIIEKHLDDDPIKSGNLRHLPPFVLGLGKDLQVLDWLFEGRVNLGKDSFPNKMREISNTLFPVGIFQSNFIVLQDCDINYLMHSIIPLVEFSNNITEDRRIFNS